MKQTQELMTQGQADEQSPDYAVTQMSKDVEAIGVHAPHKIAKLQRAAQCPPTWPLCRATLRSTCLRLSVHVLQCAVLQNPEPQGRTSAWLQGAVSAEGHSKALQITKPVRWGDPAKM